MVPLDGDGEIRALTKHTGQYASPSVSPDGRLVAFLGDDDPTTYPQNTKVGVISIDGGEHRWISTATRPHVRADRRVSATRLDRRRFRCTRWPRIVATRICTASTSTAATPNRSPSGAHHRARVRRRRPARSPTRGRPCERPAEIHTLDGPVTAITKRFLGWEKFAAPCADGSDEIDAWIMRPAEFDPSKSYPVLLNVHGGPFTQYGEMFFDEAQMQAAAGFVVLMSNPRGGSGRHTAWGQSILGPKHPHVPGTGWGSVDVEDVLAVLDTALERYPFCDADRVGMLGGSYGGYMATLLAARHGDRFKAICSERAVNNLLTEEWSSDIGTVFRVEHGPNPIEDPEEYLRMSPAMWVRDIQVPMLIIHSEEDYRCPISQAEELWVALRLLGRDVTFYRFPGENHELSRSGSPVHRRMRAEIILDFFAERLGRDTA